MLSEIDHCSKVKFMLHHLFSTLFQPIVRKSRLIYLPAYNILNDNHKYLGINKPSVLRGMDYINHIPRYLLFLS